MKSRIPAAFTALGLVATAALAADWQDIKDPAELRALYSDKTFRGHGWVGRYRADGSGVFIIQGSQPVRRTWAVKGADQVCVTPESGTVQCLTFKYVSADHKQVLVTDVATGGSAIFSVEEGVPKF
jgi:hypothetical protein